MSVIVLVAVAVLIVVAATATWVGEGVVPGRFSKWWAFHRCMIKLAWRNRQAKR